MDYLVGDIQGCCDAFEALLEKIGFSPSRDRLYVLGDLVNRGPKSLATIQRLVGLGSSAVCLLGNHDLHLLAAERSVRPLHRNDTLQEILDSPQRGEWIDWIRARPLAVQAHGWLMVHAGVVPQWDAEQTLALAQEVSAMLRGPELHDFLVVMYGNDPLRWNDTLSGPDRWRFVINVLTRIRFCTDDGTLEFGTKEGPDAPPAGYRPWFDVAARRTAGTPIAFGHWSALGLVQRPDLLAIDTGCVWGGKLTGVRIDGGRREIVQVQCEKGRFAI